MRLRLAQAADWPVVCELRLSVLENRLNNPASVTQAMYDEYIARIGRGWVAEIEGRIEGFCIVRDDGYVWALFVRPGFEGRGLARALMAECVGWLVGLGVSRAELETGAGTRAERFYRRAGWREVERNGADITFHLDLPTEA